MSIWLSWRGMTTLEITILLSAPSFIRFLATPIIGLWSDTKADHRIALLWGSWIAVLASIILPFAGEFLSFLLLIIILQLATHSLIPITEAKSLAGAQKLGVNYGSMRLWGSLSFISANIIGGLVIKVCGNESISAMLVATSISILFAAYLLPNNPECGRTQPSNFQAGLRSIKILLSEKWFLLLLISTGMIQSSHATYYVLGTLHWRSKGISDEWIGILWALGVIMEAGLFFISNRLLERYSSIGLIVIGGLSAIARWTIMALDPPFWALFPLQCLHALTFAATHLGTVNIINIHIPATQSGTAQSINTALGSGALMGIMTLLSGLLYEMIHVSSYIIMAGIAGFGVIILIFMTNTIGIKRI